MNIDAYYPEINSEIKRVTLSEFKRRGIFYRSLWNKNRSTFFRERARYANSASASEFESHLFILDFCILWISEYSGLMAISHIERTMADKADRSASHNVLSLISWKILSDAVAVRYLIMQGFDAQAKQLVRSISENIDALGLAALNSEFSEEFIVGQDVDHTNAVWHKYISKGKARKFVNLAIPNSISERNEEIREYRDAEERVLSAASHASFISGFVSIFPHFGEVEGEVGISRKVSSFSVRTMKYCCYRIMSFMIYDLITFRTFEKYLADFKTTTPVNFEQNIAYAKGGREIAVFLMKFLSESNPAWDRGGIQMQSKAT